MLNDAANGQNYALQAGCLMFTEDGVVLVKIRRLKCSAKQMDKIEIRQEIDKVVTSFCEAYDGHDAFLPDRLGFVQDLGGNCVTAGSLYPIVYDGTQLPRIADPLHSIVKLLEGAILNINSFLHIRRPQQQGHQPINLGFVKTGFQQQTAVQQMRAMRQRNLAFAQNRNQILKRLSCMVQFPAQHAFWTDLQVAQNDAVDLREFKFYCLTLCQLYRAFCLKNLGAMKTVEMDEFLRLFAGRQPRWQMLTRKTNKLYSCEGLISTCRYLKSGVDDAVPAWIFSLIPAEFVKWASQSFNDVTKSLDLENVSKGPLPTGGKADRAIRWLINFPGEVSLQNEFLISDRIRAMFV